MERPDLALELDRLAAEDLDVRQRLADTGELFGGYHPDMRIVHRRNGDRLEAILNDVGFWPGHRLVGSASSRSAFLIAQHDIANPTLMRRCRDLYARAIDQADADPELLAFLEDRIRYFEGRNQRYGTQVGWNDEGEFGPWPPVEDPERVDERRASLDMGPLAESIQTHDTERPRRRPIDEVQAEHRDSEHFARQSGWRSDEAGALIDDEHGWIALPGILSPTEIRDVLAVCDSLLQLPAAERRPRDKVASGTHHLCELDDRSRFIDVLVDRQPLMDVVTDILGPQFRRDEIAYRSPQPSFGGQKLHADDPPKLDNGPATVATAIIALTDFTVSNGATRLVPGSHLRPDLQRLSGSLENHDDQVTLTGSRGTAFMFSGHVLHSGTTNNSGGHRPALHLVWRR